MRSNERRCPDLVSVQERNGCRQGTCLYGEEISKFDITKALQKSKLREKKIYAIHLNSMAIYKVHFQVQNIQNLC